VDFDQKKKVENIREGRRKRGVIIFSSNCTEGNEEHIINKNNQNSNFRKYTISQSREAKQTAE